MLQMKVSVVVEDSPREKREVEGLTQVVNAHGGLMRLKMTLITGQSIVLVNPATRAQQRCQIVRVEDNFDGHFSVAFEFTDPNPKFWPIVFPPADWVAPDN